jgi:DNA-binding LacI/PurR family transcriptional regulator
MKKQNAPTLSDVAARAGVNRVTVSVVLNNARANTRVSEATRQRILQAAAELRYQPNAVAQSLRRRRTNILGFYSGDNYNDLRNPFFSQLVSGLQKGCEEHDQDLLIHRRRGDRTAEAVYADLVNGKVDGLILFTTPEDPLIELLAASHLPVIGLADANPAIPSVVVDDAHGGQMQVEHLAQRGHQTVFYQPGPQHLVSARRRQAAFLAAAEARGITVIRGVPTDWVGAQLCPDSQAALASHRPDRPTAVVGWEDLCAYRLLLRCQEMGWQIPQEMAVMGFDGIVQPVEPVWQLTTIRAPWRMVAYTAVLLLLAQREGKPAPPETVLPVELVPGNTT